MRIAISLIILAGLASGSALSGQPAAAPTTRDVLALEDRWTRALIERNETAFDSLLAEDLRHIGFEGQIVGKREYMAFFVSGDWKYREYSLVDRRSRWRAAQQSSPGESGARLS